ncbi:MAG TPA: acetolactate synthase small subunit [Ktedonobacterales bacterium]
MTRAIWSRESPHAGSDEQVVVALVRGGCFGLERVIGLLRRRAPTVETLNVTSGEESDESRVTISLRCGHEAAEQVAEHIRKLVDVSWAAAFPAAGGDEAALLREFALIRVACTSTTRREVVDAAQLFGARAVDVTDDSITLEISGAPETVEQLLRMLRPSGIVEVARTGRVAMPRGAGMDDGLWREEAHDQA